MKKSRTFKPISGGLKTTLIVLAVIGALAIILIILFVVLVVNFGTKNYKEATPVADNFYLK